MNFLDPDLLRTFLAFADGGSLVRAASTVGRSPSAVTAQMQRLEEIIGEPLLAAAGRGRVMTTAGEELTGHARRILAAHRDAWLAMKGARTDGRTRLGCTQDFADSSLPDLLRSFARSHARVRIELRVGRSKELETAYDQGDIDILLVMRLGPQPDELKVLIEPMIWLAAETGLASTDEAIPLALLDPPCGFRSAAIAALDSSRRSYRIAATSPSVAGLKAAVRSGLAVTPRTSRMIGPGIGLAPRHLCLPDLPEAEFTLRIRSDAEKQSLFLATLLADGLSIQIERAFSGDPAGRSAVCKEIKASRRRISSIQKADQESESFSFEKSNGRA